jgi:5-formaminoimidazole-4-carboxamide-1-beta-D-ribofuranosyl 5'-monophosphate synthetase
MNRKSLQQIVANYDREKIRIGVLGSHSALEIGHGAKQEGLEVIVVCHKGREKTYTRIPGCPCVEPTSPYMKYKYGKEVGPGRRVAMEIKQAVEQDKLEVIIT